MADQGTCATQPGKESYDCSYLSFDVSAGYELNLKSAGSIGTAMTLTAPCKHECSSDAAVSEQYTEKLTL